MIFKNPSLIGTSKILETWLPFYVLKKTFYKANLKKKQKKEKETHLKLSVPKSLPTYPDSMS